MPASVLKGKMVEVMSHVEHLKRKQTIKSTLRVSKPALDIIKLSNRCLPWPKKEVVQTYLMNNLNLKQCVDIKGCRRWNGRYFNDNDISVAGSERSAYLQRTCVNTIGALTEAELYAEQKVSEPNSGNETATVQSTPAQTTMETAMPTEQPTAAQTTVITARPAPVIPYQPWNQEPTMPPPPTPAQQMQTVSFLELEQERAAQIQLAAQLQQALSTATHHLQLYPTMQPYIQLVRPAQPAMPVTSTAMATPTATQQEANENHI